MSSLNKRASQKSQIPGRLCASINRWDGLLIRAGKRSDEQFLLDLLILDDVLAGGGDDVAGRGGHDRLNRRHQPGRVENDK